MKRIAAFISIGLICSAMVACGNSSEKETSNGDASTQVEKDSGELPSSSSAKLGEPFKTGDFEVVLKSISKASDQNDSEFVTLNFSFANKGDAESDFMNNILVEVFQGDISLSAAPDMGVTAKQNYTNLATPGETVEGVTLPFYTRSSDELMVEVQAVSELGISEPVSIKAEFPE